MTMVRLIVVALLLAAFPVRALGAQPSSPEPGSGTTLLSSCRLYFEMLGRTGAGRDDTLEQDPFGIGYCAGLVRGVVTLAESLMPTRLCVPPGTRVAHAVRAVVQHLEANPWTLEQPDTELVLRAVEDTYPCP